MDLTHSYESTVPVDVRARYEFRETRNAAAILSATNPRGFSDLVDILRSFSLLTSDLTTAGGQESALAARLNNAFRARGWREGQVNTHIKLALRLMPYRPAGEREAIEQESEVKNDGYKVDNVLDRVAMDLEWNAKDGNLDRDLAAYRALYDAGLIDCAVLITRTMDDLRLLARTVRLDAGMSQADASKMLNTTTTTNLTKLLPRMQRGDSGGCPLLAVAICERTWESYTSAPDTP